METKKNKFQQKEQIQKLIRIINGRITDIRVLDGSLIMTDKVFRLVIKEHPQLEKKWDMLHLRKYKLKRLLWKLP